MLPVYASLTYKVTSGAAWATIALVGGTVVDAHVTSASTDAETGIGSHGIEVSDRDPSFRDGSNILPPAQTVVNVVYSFSPGEVVTFQICKSDLGSVSATITRDQGPDHTQLASLTDSASRAGLAADGCENESRRQLDQAALSGPAPWPVPIDPHRHVLAVYYPWYSPATFQTGTWAETPEAPFDTSDPASVGAQIDEARSEHIDGFVVSYDGDPTYAQRLSTVTQEAASRPGFYVASMLEMNQLVTRYPSAGLSTGIDSAIKDAIARTDGPNQLQVDGRPVVFVFAAQDLSPTLWKVVRLGLGENPFFIADSTSSAYGFNGLFDYTVSFAADNQVAALDQSFEKTARWDPAVNSGAGPQRLWVAPVSPGENSCVSPPPDDDVYADREKGARYAYTWQAAIASEPEWVLVSTWNEWYEDTAVAPGSVNGSRALDETGPQAEAFETDPTELPASAFSPPGSGNSSHSCP